MTTGESQVGNGCYRRNQIYCVRRRLLLLCVSSAASCRHDTRQWCFDSRQLELYELRRTTRRTTRRTQKRRQSPLQNRQHATPTPTISGRKKEKEGKGKEWRKWKGVNRGEKWKKDRGEERKGRKKMKGRGGQSRRWKGRRARKGRNCERQGKLRWMAGWREDGKRRKMRNGYGGEKS